MKMNNGPLNKRRSLNERHYRGENSPPIQSRQSCTALLIKMLKSSRTPADCQTSDQVCDVCGQ